MMKTLIKCPKLPPDIEESARFETHKAHIRKTLKDHKYQDLIDNGLGGITRGQDT